MIYDDDSKRGSGQTVPHVRKDTQQEATTPGQRASAATGNVAESRRTPIGHRSAGLLSSFLLRLRLRWLRWGLHDDCVVGQAMLDAGLMAPYGLCMKCEPRMVRIRNLTMPTMQVSP